MAQVDELSIKITSDATKAAKALDNLSNSLTKLKGNIPSKSKLDNMAQGFSSLRQELSKLSTSTKNLDKIKAIGTIARNSGKLGGVNPRVISNTATGLNSLSSSLNNISYESIIKIERLAKALSVIPQTTPFKSIVKGASQITSMNQSAMSATSAAGGVVNSIQNAEENAKQASNALNILTKVATKTQPVLKTVGNL